MQSFIVTQLQDHQAVLKRVEEELSGQIALAAGRLIETLKIGNKLLIMGNGGSAADAQHFSGEIVSRFRMERPGLPAIALSTDTSIITAIGNDYGFERIFSRQVEALAAPGDALIGISTSGNSPNVLAGLKAATELGMVTIGWTGGTGGQMAELVDYPFVVPSENTPRIQECHITLGHVLCERIDEVLFGKG